MKVAGDDHPHESRRLSRKRDEAERAKAQDPELDEHYVDDEAEANTDVYLPMDQACVRGRPYVRERRVPTPLHDDREFLAPLDAETAFDDDYPTIEPRSRRDAVHSAEWMHLGCILGAFAAPLSSHAPLARPEVLEAPCRPGTNRHWSVRDFVTSQASLLRRSGFWALGFEIDPTLCKAPAAPLHPPVYIPSRCELLPGRWVRCRGNTYISHCACTSTCLVPRPWATPGLSRTLA